MAYRGSRVRAPRWVCGRLIDADAGRFVCLGGFGRCSGQTGTTVQAAAGVNSASLVDAGQAVVISIQNRLRSTPQ